MSLDHVHSVADRTSDRATQLHDIGTGISRVQTGPSAFGVIGSTFSNTMQGHVADAARLTSQVGDHVEHAAQTTHDIARNVHHNDTTIASSFTAIRTPHQASPDPNTHPTP